MTGGKQPLTGGRQPLTGGKQPLTGGKQPLSGGKQPLSGGKQPLSGGKRPGMRVLSPTSPRGQLKSCCRSPLTLLRQFSAAARRGRAIAYYFPPRESCRNGGGGGSDGGTFGSGCRGRRGFGFPAAREGRIIRPRRLWCDCPSRRGDLLDLRNSKNI